MIKLDPLSLRGWFSVGAILVCLLDPYLVIAQVAAPQNAPAFQQSRANPSAAGAISAAILPTTQGGSSRNAGQDNSVYPKWVSLIIKDIQNIAQTLAIIIAGIWAYFKFLKGRVFYARLEPSVAGKAINRQLSVYLYISSSIKNVGSSNVVIDRDGSALRIYGCTEEHSLEAIGVQWIRLATLPVFENHAWIEPGEVIHDDQLIFVPGNSLIAFRFELRISDGKSIWTGTGLEAA